MHIRWVMLFISLVVIGFIHQYFSGEGNEKLLSVPLPTVYDQRVDLKIVYVINSRFTRIEKDTLNELLFEAKNLVAQHFGVSIKFIIHNELDIAHLIGSVPQKVIKRQQEKIYDIRDGSGDRGRLVRTTAIVLSNRSESLDSMIEYVRPYLTKRAYNNGYHEFAESLVDTLLERIQRWKEVVAEDGKSIIKKNLYNEWAIWDSLGYGDIDYDIILTNQPIISAEYYGADIHSAIRGGMTVGTMTYSKNSRYKAFIFLSTYPFTDNNSFTIKLRGGDIYTRKEIAKFAGASLAHEIGHLIFHFGHPFNVNACVMNPVRMLNFKSWYRQLNPHQCTIQSQPSMVPGAIKITYTKQ